MSQPNVTVQPDLIERLEAAQRRIRELEGELADGVKIGITPTGAVSVSGGAVGYPVAHRPQKWVALARVLPRILKFCSENAEKLAAVKGTNGGA